MPLSAVTANDPVVQAPSPAVTRASRSLPVAGICGWIGARSTPPGRVIEAMAAGIADGQPGALRTVAAPGSCLAARMPAMGSDACARGEVLVAVCGRPRLPEGLLARIAVSHGVARALLEGYVRHAAGLFNMLSGGFAIALVDGARGEAFLAIDRMGIGSLCYEVVAGQLIFGSSLDALDAFPGTDRTLNLQAVYDYAHFHVVPAPQTIYAARRRLQPGTCLRWKNGAGRIEPYWEMRFVEDERRPYRQLSTEFRALLHRSVAAAAADGAVGAFLGGGTDSSAVTGILREVTGTSPRTYSIGFDVHGHDETRRVRTAARHLGTRHRIYYVTPDDVVRAIQRIAAAHDQPFGDSSAVSTFYCARLAREDDIRILLAAEGGNELFGGHERHARQHLLSLYGDLPAFVRHLVEPIVALLPPYGAVRRYIAAASVPMPARYDDCNLLEQLGPENVFSDDFLGVVSRRAPLAQYTDCYDAARARSLINRLLALDLKFTLADTALPRVMRSCAIAGVEPRFPMLHEDLVAFSARLRPQDKLFGTRLRPFFRKALADLLPDDAVTRGKRGFGLPVGEWLQTYSPLRVMAMESLGALVQRGIVRRGFPERLLANVHRHPHHLGTMAWVLTMLEQWLCRRRISMR